MNSAEEVAVVGAGVAGMGAAFRLQQAGYRVRVFEAADRVCGRTRTEYRDGFVMNQGATIMWSGYKSVLGIVADAGLQQELVPAGSGLGFVRGPHDIYNFDTEHLIRDALGFPLSNRARLTVLKLGVDSLRALRRLSYEDLSQMAEFDGETPEDYGRRRLNQEVMDELVRPAVKSLVAAPASEVSNVDLLFSIARFMGIGTRWLAFRQGMGSYCDLLSRRFDVELNARVTAVEEHGDEVTIGWETAEGAETARFAGCVIAVPAPLAAAMHQTLDPWRKRFLEEVGYSALQVVNLALSKPPAGIPGTLFAHPETEPIFTSVFEHNKYSGLVPPGKGLVSLYTSDEVARELLGAEDEVVVERVLREAEKVLPPMADDIEFTAVRHWEKAVLRTHPGYYRDLAEFHALRKRRDRLVQLAGDYFAPSSINTASTAGERAAKDLLSALGAVSATRLRRDAAQAGQLARA